jgi:hypothetical protein
MASRAGHDDAPLNVAITSRKLSQAARLRRRNRADPAEVAALGRITSQGRPGQRQVVQPAGTWRQVPHRSRPGQEER